VKRGGDGDVLVAAAVDGVGEVVVVGLVAGEVDLGLGCTLGRNRASEQARVTEPELLVDREAVRVLREDNVLWSEIIILALETLGLVWHISQAQLTGGQEGRECLQCGMRCTKQGEARSAASTYRGRCSCGALRASMARGAWCRCVRGRGKRA
jgi:hypothetical protein